MTKILETGDLQHTEVRQNRWTLDAQRKRELTHAIRLESAKDLRMTAWELVQLIEAFEL